MLNADADLEIVKFLVEIFVAPIFLPSF
jgi:hypothetical protein